MKPLLKVVLATVALVGIVKLAKKNGGEKGKCQNFRNKRMAFLEKVRAMNEEDFHELKSDIESRNFRKMKAHFCQKKETA